MKVILIRHGRTAGNMEKRYVGGRTDQPLCSEGMAELTAAGTYPGVKTVFVSPMLRARQTAAGLFPRARQVVLEGLREMDFGDFEGKTAQEMENDGAYRAWVDSFCLAACPHGEDAVTVGKRVLAAMMQAIAQNDGETAVFVAHGGSIMSALLAQGMRLEGDMAKLKPHELTQFLMPNLAATVGRWDGEKLTDCRVYKHVAEISEELS